jgi:hypothetical protein
MLTHALTHYPPPPPPHSIASHCFNSTPKPCHPPSTRRHHHTALHCISVSVVAHDTNPIPLLRTYFIILTRPPFHLFFSCQFSTCAMVQRSFGGVYHHHCSIIFVFLFCFCIFGGGGWNTNTLLSWCFGRVSEALVIVLFGGGGGWAVCLFVGWMGRPIDTLVLCLPCA